MSKQFTITFAGDTSLGMYYLTKPKRQKQLERLLKDPMSFFRGLKGAIKGSDYFILNLETVLANNPKSIHENKSYQNWDDPNITLKVLKKLKVDAVSLANNHTMDFGSEVMLETKRLLEENNIHTYGAGINQGEAEKPYKFTLVGEKSSKNVYIFTGMKAEERYHTELNFMATNNSPAVNNLDNKRMIKQINYYRTIDPESVIIINPHWQGIDYQWANEFSDIRVMCREFIDAGADMVIGHGTHMLSTIEEYKGKRIVYSIGNFVFTSPGRYKKLGVPPCSLITKVQIEENDGKWLIKDEHIPIFTDNRRSKFKPYIINNDELQTYLNKNKNNNKDMQKELKI